jgi:hypothetical protein
MLPAKSDRAPRYFQERRCAGSTGDISTGALHLESSIIARNTSAGVGSDIGTVADGIGGSPT